MGIASKTSGSSTATGRRNITSRWTRVADLAESSGRADCGDLVSSVVKCVKQRVTTWENTTVAKKLIDLEVAKRQLVSINDYLKERHLLIGGLAVQRYVPTRDSRDIDLVCTYDLRERSSETSIR